VILIDCYNTSRFYVVPYMFNMQEDEFAWLRDPSWPQEVKKKEVLEFVNTANDKCSSYFDSIQSDVSNLFDEMKARISEDDFTPPVKIDDYFYYSYINKGNDYWVHARKHLSLDAQEEIVLDENKRAHGIEFFNIEEVKSSPNHKYTAYSINTTGDERYFIEVKDLFSGDIVESNVNNVFGSIIWDSSSSGFFYIKCDDDWRAKEVYYHKLEDAQSDDTLVFKESDGTFWVGICNTSDNRYLTISSKSGTSNEVYLVDLSYPLSDPKLLKARKEGCLYYVSSHGDCLYIIINDTGRNFRLIKTSISEPFEDVEELLPYNSREYLESVTCYKNWIVIEKRILGLVDISVFSYDLSTNHSISFEDSSYSASHIFTSFDSESVRYSYSSLSKPNKIMEISINTKSISTLKTQSIPSGFNENNYQVERIWAKSEDGVEVPISLVYNKHLFKKDGSNPLYLYGYGSYGISVNPYFRSTIFSLVDRGFVYAIAHIRGGDDLGYEWYESAKFLNKKKTFEDFIYCAKHLANEKYTSEGKITICGGSAGGMLIGATINMAAHLFKSAILHVPFVDVLNTMLDDTLPLTPGEFKEWGNPKDVEFFEYMRSYSPYDNISAKEYPNILITAGLKDPRVSYWEPAKFYAKLSKLKLDKNYLFMKTNMGAGHFGKSGRYDHLKEIAEEFAFVLNMQANH
jgi:oligopeptidase B